VTYDEPAPRHRASREETSEITAKVDAEAKLRRRVAVAARPRPTSKQRIGSYATLAFLIVVFLALVYFVLLVVMDSTGQQWSRCTVYSAVAKPGGRGGPYVELTTSCGPLALDKGVTRGQTEEEVARRFTPGRDYEFKLGRTARHPGWWIGDSTVHDWRKV